MCYPTITATGHLGQDPVLYTSQSGTDWTRFSVACTKRIKDKNSGQWSDGGTTWLTVKLFGVTARNAVASLKRGTPVTVTGSLAVDEYTVSAQAGQDEKRFDLVVENAHVAVDISHGTIDGYQRHVSSSPTDASTTGTDDPWGTP